MKKRKKIISLLLMMAISLSLLASCVGGNVASEGIATVVVEKSNGDRIEYTVDLSKLEDRSEGALSVLKHLAADENDGFAYSVNSGGYGAYITSICGLEPDPTSEYIGIYTNEKADFAVPTEYMPTVWTQDYENTELTYTGVGLSSMHVGDGTVMLFRIESF